MKAYLVLIGDILTIQDLPGAIAAKEAELDEAAKDYLEAIDACTERFGKRFTRARERS